jgi:hypothetical protein
LEKSFDSIGLTSINLRKLLNLKAVNSCPKLFPSTPKLYQTHPNKPYKDAQHPQLSKPEAEVESLHYSIALLADI